MEWLSPPKCSAPGCRLWVWNEAPTKAHCREGGVFFEQIGPSVPKSGMCYFHHHGKPVPEGSR
jgi:hypothetical protein